MAATSTPLVCATECAICCELYDSGDRYPYMCIANFHALCMACAVKTARVKVECPSCKTDDGFEPNHAKARELDNVSVNRALANIGRAVDPRKPRGVSAASDGQRRTGVSYEELFGRPGGTQARSEQQNQAGSASTDVRRSFEELFGRPSGVQARAPQQNQAGSLSTNARWSFEELFGRPSGIQTRFEQQNQTGSATQRLEQHFGLPSGPPPSSTSHSLWFPSAYSRQYTRSRPVSTGPVSTGEHIANRGIERLVVEPLPEPRSPINPPAAPAADEEMVDVDDTASGVEARMRVLHFHSSMPGPSPADAARTPDRDWRVCQRHGMLFTVRCPECASERELYHEFNAHAIATAGTGDCPRCRVPGNQGAVCDDCITDPVLMPPPHAGTRYDACWRTLELPHAPTQRSYIALLQESLIRDIGRRPDNVAPLIAQRDAAKEILSNSSLPTLPPTPNRRPVTSTFVYGE